MTQTLLYTAYWCLVAPAAVSQVPEPYIENTPIAHVVQVGQTVAARAVENRVTRVASYRRFVRKNCKAIIKG